jgi:hypothetical protein
VVTQVHRDDIGRARDGARGAQAGQLGRERGQVEVAGAVVADVAGRLLQEQQIELRPAQASTVGPGRGPVSVA